MGARHAGYGTQNSQSGKMMHEITIKVWPPLYPFLFVSVCVIIKLFSCVFFFTTPQNTKPNIAPLLLVQGLCRAC